MMSVRKCVKINAGLTFSPLWVCLTAAVFVGLLGGFVPQVLGLGTDFIEAISKPEYAIRFLVALLFLKILATSVCLGFGLSVEFSRQPFSLVRQQGFLWVSLLFR